LQHVPFYKSHVCTVGSKSSGQVNAAALWQADWSLLMHVLMSPIQCNCWVAVIVWDRSIYR